MRHGHPSLSRISPSGVDCCGCFRDFRPTEADVHGGRCVAGRFSLEFFRASRLTVDPRNISQSRTMGASFEKAAPDVQRIHVLEELLSCRLCPLTRTLDLNPRRLSARPSSVLVRALSVSPLAPGPRIPHRTPPCPAASYVITGPTRSSSPV